MSHSPQRKAGSKRYKDAWRAINLLIRSDGSWSGHERNTCYLNQSGGKFRDASFVSGLDFTGDGRSFVPVDIDRDGDLDLILKFRTAPQLRVLRNDLPNRSAGRPGALQVRLVGTKSNRDAVGARVVLETNQRRLMREVHCGSGFLSQPSRRLHFGLSPQERPQSLKVRWPNGDTQTFAELGGRTMQLTEGRKEVVPISFRLPEPVDPEPAADPQGSGTRLMSAIPAPDFSLEGLSGKQRLSDLRGRKVLLNFWATWCPPCREELADLKANAGKFEKAGITVLAVSVDEPAERAQVQEFAADRGLPFPVLFADDHVVNSYTVLNRNLFDRRRDLAIPTSFLLDETGKIVKVYPGVTESSAILGDAKAESGPALPFAGKWLLSPPQRDYAAIATAMAERGLAAEARTLFDAALAAGAGGAEVYNNLATLLLQEGDLDRSEELLRKSLSLNPRQVEARVNLGSLLLKRGEAQRAINVLQTARKMQPDDAFLHDALGSAYFKVGKMAAAEKSYQEAIRLEPASPDYRYNLGSALATSGRFPEALAAFEKSRQLGRDDAELMTNLGVLYMETGQPQKALKEFQGAIKLDPADFGNHLNLAMYHLRAGDPAQAQAAIDQAKSLAPDNPSPHLLEAQMLASQGDARAAKTILKRLLQQHPGLRPAAEMLRQLNGR